jgi:glyoxylase-like metal-dependent hydrolase (beta-lactamase superfamily II)
MWSYSKNILGHQTMGEIMKTKWLAGPDRALTRFGEVHAFREGLYQVGQGSYAWMTPNGSWGESNLGLIDCAGKSVLIDTCWDLKFTREVLQTAQLILEKSPVQHVINTHSDGDHCWANQLFEGHKIIATHVCIRRMHHLNPRSLRALKYLSKLLCHVPFMRGSAPSCRFPSPRGVEGAGAGVGERMAPSSFFPLPGGRGDGAG